MRLIGALCFVTLNASFLASCAASPPPSAETSGEPGQALEVTPSTEGIREKSASASSETQSEGQPTAVDDDHEAASEEESPCPDEMVYVEGEYCTAASNEQKPDRYGNTPGGGAADIEAIERQCLKEWYAPQNDKRVCEEFSKEASCSGKMVKKRFCIDRYAWPNVKGHKPEVMNRFHQAQVKCAAAGKRLCTESEWTMSCEGPSMLPFPYGVKRDATKCHGDEPWDQPKMNKVAARDEKELRRLYKGKRSGQEGCESDYGVFDLPGNTDEIVASETFERGKRGEFDSVHTGGPWYKGVRNQCRPKIYSHDEGFYYYFLSFRCCADTGADEVEPLTPKQQKEGWDMKRVERIAGITVDEMKRMLEKKKTDPTCGCKTTRCKTYCGTLHGDPGEGPDAWDAPLGERAGNGMPTPAKASDAKADTETREKSVRP